MALIPLNDIMFVAALLLFILIVGPMLYWMTGAKHGSEE